jgi:MFS family permease
VFKTESLVISTFALALGATPAQLGWFPFVSRMGKFLPQFLVGRALDPLPRKRPITLLAHVLFVLGWLGLGIALLFYGERTWTYRAFFVVYACTWVVMGVVIVGIGTLNGKLIRPDLRGRLLGTSQLVGGTLAFASIALLHFLIRPGEAAVFRFGIVFVLAGGLFLMASIGLLVLREPPLRPENRQKWRPREVIRDARELFKGNPNYRRIVGLQFMMNMLWSGLMFYASFGRECMGEVSWLKMTAIFLLMQTIGRTVCSVTAGALADRFGNRVVIRVLAVMLALLPLSAALLGMYTCDARPWLWAPVYLMIGLLIPLLPLSTNYLLEVTPVERHASCLGTANGIMVFAAFTPLVVGPLIGWLGHGPVFIGLSILMLGAVYFAMRLGEPRFEAEPTAQMGPLP